MRISPAARLCAAVLTLSVSLIGLSTPANAGRTHERLGKLQGQLVDQSGQPVHAGKVVAGSLDEDRTTSTSLNRDGRFTMNVKPGRYWIEFSVDGAFQYVPHTRDLEMMDEFTVVAGQTTTVDDVLLPTGSFGGKLVDHRGKPVANAYVDVMEVQSVGFRTKTDKNGVYRLDYLFTGTYQVRIEKKGIPSQWAYGKTVQSEATKFIVAAGKRTTVNVKLLQPGAVAGTFRKSNGKPYPGVSVRVTPVADGVVEFVYTKTDRQGRFRLPAVLPGRYVVRFASDRVQYAYGKATQDAATRFVVKSGKTTTVNDRQLKPATLRVTATDANTGEKLSEFCAWTLNDKECTKKSEIVFKNLQPRPDETLHVGPYDEKSSFYLDTKMTVSTAAGKTTEVTAKLSQGGVISTTAIDRETGSGVNDTCITTVAPDGTYPGVDCSDPDGSLRTGTLPPGTYKIFVRPDENVPASPDKGSKSRTTSAPKSIRAAGRNQSFKYGAQWLGSTGGTGDQRAAADIVVEAGKVTTAPTVKLDRPGTIAGTVTSATDGKPIAHAAVYDSSPDSPVRRSRKVETDTDGRYSIDGLGPYAWPLYFMTSQGNQWSGGKDSWLTAVPITVESGATVTHDEVIGQHVALRGGH